ncbi:MAG: hemerythrin domain-containing protein [Vicinamibacteria bacterium]|nr:hemerythrin domain-containing protein [Vicinamibacteria bacterium]
MDLGSCPLNPVTVTEYMSGDHQEIDALRDAAVRALEGGDHEAATARFAAYTRRLERHIRLEEELLFPLFEVRTGVSGGPTGVLREEHDELQRVVAEAAAAAEAGHGFAEALDALARTVDEHCVREERVLFPMLDRQLLPNERAALVARLTRE